MKNFLSFLLLFAASACSAVQGLPPTDSTRVEVRVEREFVHDTAWIELPRVVERVAVLDTVSVLENEFAASSALVSDGVLHHSLETKAVSVPVRVEKEIVWRDSLVYRDRVRTVTVEVPRQLTAWQQAKLRVGGFCFFLILLIVLYLIVSHLFNLKSFLL